MDGQTFIEELDGPRLRSQYGRVYKLMQDGQWRTIPEIRQSIQIPEKHDSEAAISARLRDFRKVGHTVERQRRGNPKSGLFEYRLEVVA